MEIDREQQKVTVMGFVNKDKVLNKVRRKGKLAELWPTEAVEVGEGEHEPENLMEVITAGRSDLEDYPYAYNRSLQYPYVNGGQHPSPRPHRRHLQ